MIVYQMAMILCVISESVGTAALSGMAYPCNNTHCVDQPRQQTTSTNKMAYKPEATAEYTSRTTT